MPTKKNQKPLAIRNKFLSLRKKRPLIKIYAVLDSRGNLVGGAPFDGVSTKAAAQEVVDTLWVAVLNDLMRKNDEGYTPDEALALLRILGWKLVTPPSKKHLDLYTTEV